MSEVTDVVMPILQKIRADLAEVKRVQAEHSERFERIDQRFERIDQRFEQKMADGIEARRVAFTDIPGVGYVSTIFLGLPDVLSELRGDEPPLLFETMAFGGPLDQEEIRTATWSDAEQAHVRVVDACKARAAAGRGPHLRIVPPEA